MRHDSPWTREAVELYRPAVGAKGYGLKSVQADKLRAQVERIIETER